jgi:hypothetical protein
MFVVAIVEHESQVNYRASFKMLQYIALILGQCERDADKDNPGISETKSFMYPPVLPIVFHDGIDTWTAETNFLYKTELHEVFEKYIPKFEYELVSLKKYSQADLIKFGDALSLILIIDKIRTSDGMSSLAKLPPDYIEQLQLNLPPHILKLLSDVISLLLKKINVSDEEVENVTKGLYERRVQEMFEFFEGYDVQKVRREVREETWREAIDSKALRAAERALGRGAEPNDVAYDLELPIEKVLEIKSNLQAHTI